MIAVWESDINISYLLDISFNRTFWASYSITWPRCKRGFQFRISGLASGRISFPFEFLIISHCKLLHLLTLLKPLTKIYKPRAYKDLQATVYGISFLYTPHCISSQL